MNEDTGKKLTKLGDEENFSVFHRMAAKHKEANKGKPPAPKNQEDELTYTDSEGRTCINTEAHKKYLEKEARNKALDEHGNDCDKRLDICNFPRKDRQFMLTYDYKKTLEKFKGMVITDESWIFIHGSPGTGKTTLAMRMFWEYMRMDPARYTSFLSVREWIQQQYALFTHSGLDKNAELPALKKYVILDDFDKISFTEWQMLQIFRLVDFLDRNNNRVIITSNHNLTQLLEKSQYDLNYKATLDRIAGRAKKTILGMSGGSHRNKNVQL